MRVLVIADCLGCPTTADDIAMDAAIQYRVLREECGIDEKFSTVKSHVTMILAFQFLGSRRCTKVTSYGYLEFNVKFQITGYQRTVIGYTRCIIRNH